MLFKSIKNNTQFEKDGFVVIHDFFETDQIARLKTIYSSLHLDNIKTIYTNIIDRNPEENQEIARLLSNEFENNVDKHFCNYTLVGGVFLVKGVGENSASKMHQDWNMVDESKYHSFGVWCPLIDVDETNGCIHVIPGSHKWFKSIRSHSMPSVIIEFDEVKDSLKAVPLKKGDAVIFAHNLFHGSKPNTTIENRPAAYIGVISKDAQLIHYIRNENMITEIKADDQFFVENVRKMNKKEDFTFEIIKQFSYKHSFTVSKHQVLNKMSTHQNFLSRFFKK
jgi:hypothetical protein